MKWFVNHFDEAVEIVRNNLISETYKFGEMTSFVVHEPKERIIHHPKHFIDRVYHCCLLIPLVPIFLERFTADTYGSIKGRGIYSIIRNLKPFLHNHPDWYFLQIDIRKFYPSINHEVLKAQFRRLIRDKKTLRLIDAIIDAYGPGMAIGVWPSQYFANFNLCGLDHYVKEVLHVKGYFRYMDDMLFLVKTKEEAQAVYKAVNEYVTNKLKLIIKPNYRIAPIKYGIEFVGYKFYPHYILLRNSIKRRMKKRVRRYYNAPNKLFQRKAASYLGWGKHGDCMHLLRYVYGNKLSLFKSFRKLNEVIDEELLKDWVDSDCTGSPDFGNHMLPQIPIYNGRKFQIEEQYRILSRRGQQQYSSAEHCQRTKKFKGQYTQQSRFHT